MTRLFDLTDARATQRSRLHHPSRSGTEVANSVAKASEHLIELPTEHTSTHAIDHEPVRLRFK